MKKLNLIFSVLCAICLAGCNREEPSVSLSDNMDVAVNAGRYVDTKAWAGDTAAGEELLCTRQFVTEEGDTLYISAYLSDMEVSLPSPMEGLEKETKGAPVSSSNLGTLYGQISTTVYDADGIYVSEDKDGNTTTMEDVSVTYASGKWGFGGTTYYWPKAGGDLYFCSMAPVELLSGSDETGSVTNLSWNGTDKKYSFNYIMPAPETDEAPNDAMNQKDILIGVDTNNKSNGSKAKINLYHALTGVRFVMGETLELMPSKVSRVSLNNFFSQGTATFDPSVTPSDTQPNVTWSNLSERKSYTQSFSATETASWTKNQSFDGTANNEKTFMVIPQKLETNAELSIYLASALHPEVLTFDMITDEEPALADWSKYAGKMITFRINSYVGLVSVKVDDNCDTANGVKSNIAITNDGNADIFVRAELVGNWINSNGQILASWREDDSYGTFVSSKGSNANLSEILDDNWQKAADGFYYYRYIIGSGQVLKHNMFDTFTLSGKPHDSDGKWEGNVDMQIDALELTILVQAVKADSGKASAIAAWGSGNVGFLTDTADN